MAINSLSHYSFFLGLFVAFTTNKKEPPAFGAELAFWCHNLAFLGLSFCHISNNNSQTNHTLLAANAPFFYQISGTWSNHEGSLLLWCWILSFFGFLLCYRGRPQSHNVSKLGGHRSSLYCSFVSNFVHHSILSLPRDEEQRYIGAAPPHTAVLERNPFVRRTLVDSELRNLTLANPTQPCIAGLLPFAPDPGRKMSFAPLGARRSRGSREGQKTPHNTATSLARKTIHPPSILWLLGLGWAWGGWGLVGCHPTNSKPMYGLGIGCCAIPVTPNKQPTPIHTYVVLMAPTTPNIYLDGLALSFAIGGWPYSWGSWVGDGHTVGGWVWDGHTYVGYGQTGCCIGGYGHTVTAGGLHLARDAKERTSSSIDEQRIDSAVGIALFFSFFLLASSDPFVRNFFVCTEPLAELNPVLQDPILAIHPPCIYAGGVASAMGFGLCRSKMMNGIVALHSPPMQKDAAEKNGTLLCSSGCVGSRITSGLLTLEFKHVDAKESQVWPVWLTVRPVWPALLLLRNQHGLLMLLRRRFFAFSSLWTGALMGTGREQAQRVVRHTVLGCHTARYCPYCIGQTGPGHTGQSVLPAHNCKVTRCPPLPPSTSMAIPIHIGIGWMAVTPTPTHIYCLFGPYTGPVSWVCWTAGANTVVSDQDQEAIRIWILTCWFFLTVGVSLGSWWAYHELGWGGWWFWDPVENASFMPWVVATACIHSVIFPLHHSWTLLLSIVTFLCCVLGTFSIRSGLLASVHSFAIDDTRGRLGWWFFLLMTGISLFLFSQMKQQASVRFTYQPNSMVVARRTLVHLRHSARPVLLWKQCN